MTRRTVMLSVLCASAFLGALDLQLVNLAFPAMLRDFRGADITGLSWVLNGYTITFTGALLPAGGLADRFGHRRVYLTGLAVFLASAAVCAAAPSVLVLALARTAQGVGGGVITPLSLALILPEFPADRRGAGVALWSAAQSAAVASGPSLGGFLVGTWGWRTIFLLHLPLGLAILAGAWKTLPSGRAETARIPDLLGLTLLVCAIGLPALAIVQAGVWSIPALLAGLAATAWFVRRTLHHPAPIVDLRILGPPQTRWANTAMFTLGLVMFGWTLAAVLFLTSVWGYPETRAGLALTPGPVAQVVLAPLSARLIRRFGHRTVALTGATLLGLAALDLAMATSGRPAYLTTMLPALVAAGAGITLQITALSGAAVAEVPADRLATGTALSVTSRACGAVVGLAAVTLALSRGSGHSPHAHHLVWLAMLALCATEACLLTRLHRRRPPRPADGPTEVSRRAIR